MSSQHNRDKRSVRVDAETVAGLLLDSGLRALSTELRDALQTAHHCERTLTRYRSSEAFAESAEAHRRLEYRVKIARETMFDLASCAVREGNGAVYFAGNSWAPEKAIGLARRIIECAQRADSYIKHARKLTTIGVAKQATDRVIPVQIVTVN